MIKEIDSIKDYEEFVNELSVDPRYADPHYTYDKRNLYHAFEREDHRVFVVLKEAEVIGLFAWMIMPNERCVEMIIGFSKYEEAYREMMAYIDEQYKGYQFDIVFNPKNTRILAVLQEKNAEIDPPQQKMNWFQERSVESEYHVQQISPEYEAEYLAFHHTDCYWTGERVLEAKHLFRVFIAVKDSKLIGYLDVTYSKEENEIYDMRVKEEYADTGCEEALITEAVRCNPTNQMMVLVEMDDEKLIKMYRSSGFESVECTESQYAKYYA